MASNLTQAEILADPEYLCEAMRRCFVRAKRRARSGKRYADALGLFDSSYPGEIARLSECIAALEREK